MRLFTRIRTAAIWLAATLGYTLLTCALTWPLGRQMRTHLLGDPSGDTGVYVWNLWIFRHELLRHGHLPFSTSHVFSYTGGADFSLHNFTPIAGLLAAPLIGRMGIVGAFNVVLLTFLVLSALGVFMLARRIGLGTVAAWSAGALFVASPIITAKETAHFSLVLAAPLPLFLWALLRALETERLRDAVLVGALVAVASYSDAYFGIYCAMMGVFLVLWRFTRVEWRGSVGEPARIVRALDLSALTTGLLIAWRCLSGSQAIAFGPVKIGLQTLYTPMLLLVLLLTLRIWLMWRPVVRFDDPAGRLKRLLRLGAVAVSVCLLLMSPVLVGIALRFATNRLPETEIYWRSGRRGLDALAYFVPNPNHPWFGERTRQWLMPDRSDAFPEFVGSFSIVAFVVIAFGAWRRCLPRVWVAFTALFASLSLGPFIHVGGVNTYVVGPWAFLRYVPVFEMAQSPTRLAIVAALGLCLLFGFVVEDFRRRHSGRTQWFMAGLVLTALAVELVPAPRFLHSAEVPDVYRLVAASGDESGRLLELPTGVRDGTSSLGNFNASTQFFQTAHRRPLIGGYLSRVSRWRKRENIRVPMLRVLFALSEGRSVSPEWLEEARLSRDAFLQRSCVRFVIINRRLASGELRTFAVEALGLTLVHEDASYELLAPSNLPVCDVRPRRARRVLQSLIWRDDP